MSRALGLPGVLLALLVLVLAGCGTTTEIREPDVVVRGGSAPVSRAPTGSPGSAGNRGAAARIAVVTHGQGGSPFWTVVKTGVEAAERQMDVVVSYRSPDVYSVPRMRALIREVLATRPDALVVSIPSNRLGTVIRGATDQGIPVVSINSGSDLFRRFGVLAHVGQPEDMAGLGAGRRLARAGARRALCLNHEVGNEGLDKRCRGLQQAMRERGGSSRVVSIDVDDLSTPRRIAGILRDRRVDGILTLDSRGAMAAVEGRRLADRADDVEIGAFDLSPEVLEAVRAGQVGFAVDQQAYLQGYLPIVMLAQRIRYGLFPGQGEIIPTGPNFVTRGTAAQAIRLSRRSIR